MIRVIIAYTAVALYLILGIIPLGILWIIGRFNEPLMRRLSLKMVQTAFRFLLWTSGVKLEVIGRDNVPDDTAVLYVSNHRSYFDILTGYTQVKGFCGFVSKIQMKKVPFLGNWMELLYCLFMDRDDMRQSMQTILKGTEQLKSGVSVWICPEGTRNRHPDETPTLEFKEGSLKMAEKAKVPVVPVAISGTWEVWERQYPRIKKGIVHLEFGTPFYIADLDKETKKHAGAYTRERINDMLAKYPVVPLEKNL
jgi:1-acyl-sn-glycerol-3-phosphate acyltransferase